MSTEGTIQVCEAFCNQCRQVTQMTAMVYVYNQVFSMCQSCVNALRGTPHVTVSFHTCTQCGNYVEFTYGAILRNHGGRWCEVCMSVELALEAGRLDTGMHLADPNWKWKPPGQ